MIMREISTAECMFRLSIYCHTSSVQDIRLCVLTAVEQGQQTFALCKSRIVYFQPNVQWIPPTISGHRGWRLVVQLIMMQVKSSHTRLRLSSGLGFHLEMWMNQCSMLRKGNWTHSPSRSHRSIASCIPAATNSLHKPLQIVCNSEQAFLTITIYSSLRLRCFFASASISISPSHSHTHTRSSRSFGHVFCCNKETQTSTAPEWRYDWSPTPLYRLM